MRIVWQCESDPYARAVLRKHWPDVELHEDVRAKSEQGTLFPLTSSAGGSPARTSATPESEWALRASARGSGASTPESFASYDPATSSWRTWQRSLLGGWSEFSETWPRAGMTRNGTAYRLAALGAPHLRDRLFLVAYAVRNGCLGGRREEGNLFPQEWSASGEIEQRYRRQRGVGANGSHSTDADAAGERWREGWSASNARRQAGAGASEHVAGARDWSAPPFIRRMDARSPSRVDRLRCLGNAVVPQVAEYIGRLILAHAEQAVIASRQLPLSVPGNGGEGA
jgi:DNA (cytosine-5)-methyltransferase 1